MSESHIQRLSRLLRTDENIDRWVDGLGEVESIRLRYDWPSWARPEQLMPDTDWLSKGFLGGRGMGKTRPCAEYVVEAIESGESRFMGMCAQNEDRAWEVMVEGDSGLIACSPPWFRPVAKENELEWPNGAKTLIYTPMAPDSLFGPQHDLFWASEIHAWQRGTAMASWNNLKLGLRLGRARLIWDSNPKPRCPILLGLIAKHLKHPERHLLTRGSTRDNDRNLNRQVVEEWYDELGGTVMGKVMLDGDMLEDVEGALWKRADIVRLPTPASFERIVIGVDPAVTCHSRSDLTGIVVVGMHNGMAYVLEDLSGRHEWESWGSIVVDTYMRWRASKVIVERNRGGDACLANIRLSARAKGFEAVKVAEGPNFPHQPSVVRVLDVSSTVSKASRAQPAVAAYQRGLVAHGADLEELEDEMCGWDGAGDSPNRLDSLVFAVCDIIGMGSPRRASPADVQTTASAMKTLQAALRTNSPKVY